MYLSSCRGTEPEGGKRRCVEVSLVLQTQTVCKLWFQPGTLMHNSANQRSNDYVNSGLKEKPVERLGFKDQNR